MRRPYDVLLGLRAPVFWCLHCNVPVLEKACGRCGRDAVPVRVTPPGDIRPAFGGELERVRKSISEYFEDPAKAVLPEDRVVLLNNISYPDAADEVIVDGQVVGHCFYDPLQGRWRFKPVYAGVARMVRDGVGFYAVVDVPKLTRGYTVHKPRIVKGRLPKRRGVFVGVESVNGMFQGVAEYVGGRRLRVVKAWRSVHPLEGLPPSSWGMVVEAGRKRLEGLVAEGVGFLWGLTEKHRDRSRVVSFSGGKDSLATLLLTLEAWGDVPVLFNDTGIEVPGTREYVEELCERLGLRLVVADAGDRFFKAVKVFGPPARDYRWCCKVVKLACVARAVREVFGGHVLSVVGVRRFESAARARSPRVWRNRWLPDVLAASPIMDWVALDVWLFLWSRDAHVNPLYELGFNRLGCWLCPASELGELELVREKFPEYWSEWEGWLRRWAASSGLSKDWVRYGVWRWRRVPGDYRRLLEKAGVEAMDIRRFMDSGFRVVATEDGVEGVLERLGGREGVARLAGFLRVYGVVRLFDDHLFFICDYGGIRVYVDGEVEAWGEGEHLLGLLKRAYLRAALCVGCGLCSAWCGKGAIEMRRKKAFVDLDRCSGCGVCEKVCPLVEFGI